MVPLTTRPAVQAAAPGALDPVQGLAQPGTLLTPAPGKSGEHSGPGQSPGAPWGELGAVPCDGEIGVRVTEGLLLRRGQGRRGAVLLTE